MTLWVGFRGGVPPPHDGVLWMVLDGFGWFWMVLDGFGWFWVASGGGATPQWEYSP